MKKKSLSTDKKVVTFGEVMLRLTTPGFRRFSQTNEFIATYGGSEANVAVSLAHFGIPTEFVTRLPDNAVSRACINSLRASGLGTDGIVFGGKRLGLYYLECGAAFRNSNVVYDREGSSFATLRPGMIDWETIFADAGWFHWSGIAAALSQEGADACREALEIADRMGLTISCDLNFRKKLWNYGCTAAEVMQPLVQYSDVIFGAEPEYQEILGIQPVGFRAVDTADVSFESDLPSFEKFGQEVERLVPRCQKVFLELRNSITSNHNVLAAVLYSDGTLKHTGIYDIEHETDRVGAGDAFVGGMIYGLITYPDDDRKALDFALAASALKNTVYFTVIVVPCQCALALALALLVSKKFRGVAVFRTMYFAPQLTSMVVISVLWSVLYNANPNTGLINSILVSLGMSPIKFLSDASTAMNSIIFMSAWQGAGYQMMIFLAGLQGIPRDQYEAASVDGATKFKQFLYITLPGLKGTIKYVIMITMIQAMKLFTQPYIMTQGGPKNSTKTLVYYIYTQGFQKGNFGYACSIAAVFFVIVVCMSMAMKKVTAATD